MYLSNINSKEDKLQKVHVCKKGDLQKCKTTSYLQSTCSQSLVSSPDPPRPTLMRAPHRKIITVGMQWVFEGSLVWSMILQPILHTSTEEAYEDSLAALW